MTQNKPKKQYVKPSMQVYDLPSQPSLLQGSMPTDPNWPGGLPW